MFYLNVIFFSFPQDRHGSELEVSDASSDAASDDASSFREEFMSLDVYAVPGGGGESALSKESSSEWKMFIPPLPKHEVSGFMINVHLSWCLRRRQIVGTIFRF